jgi:predicted RNase H-like nuclease
MLADLGLSSSLKFSAVGIDGCRAGWVIAFQLGGEPVLALVKTLSELAPHLGRETTVMIDMPIGLLNDASSRECDALARERLRPYRSSSVFGVPPRVVTRICDYPQANALSRELTGKGLSKQSFYLFPKIRELDDWLVNPERQGEWWECHPEVAFAQLNAGIALNAAKKSEEGQAERISLLADLAGVDAALERASQNYKRKDLLPDDCIDALVCLLTAERDQHQRIVIPATPDKDERGLMMGIMAPA